MSKTLEKLDEVAPKVLDQMVKAGEKAGEVIGGITDSTTSVVKSLVSQIETEAPQVCAELIALARVESVCYLLCSLIVGIILVSLLKKLINYTNKSDCNLEIIFFAWVGQISASLILVIVVCSNFHSWLIPIVAPRVYLIEYFLQQYKSMKG